jgi:hypothetical protein
LTGFLNVKCSVGKEKRVRKAMDALFLKKINLLTVTMSKPSDDF